MSRLHKDCIQYNYTGVGFYIVHKGNHIEPCSHWIMLKIGHKLQHGNVMLKNFNRLKAQALSNRMDTLVVNM